MTTFARLCVDAREASPAIHITGRPKTLVTVADDLFFKEAKYFCDTIIQGNRQNIQMSLENRQRRHAANAFTKIPEEMRKMKDKEFIDIKWRQQLRNECAELRALAESLRLAKITKDLDEHMAEIHRNRQLAINANAQGLKRAEAERQQQLAAEQAQDLLKKEQQQKLRESLSTQIEERRRRQKQNYLQTLADREERMAMQRQIEEEIRAEQLAQEQLKRKKHTDMIEFIEQRREYQQLQRAKSNEDITKVIEKQMEIAEQKHRMEEAKLEAQRKKAEISLRIGHQVLEVENRKRQRNNLLVELLQAEYKAKDDARYRQQLEQEQMERQRARQELERYRTELFERNLEEARKKQKEPLDKNIICSDCPDSAAKALDERRQRKEHGALLLSMIEDNNRKRAEAAAEHLQFFEVQATEEAETTQRIKEERLKMLGCVPAEVLQYLPSKLLSESERKYFNVQKKRYSPIKPFAQSGPTNLPN